MGRSLYSLPNVLLSRFVSLLRKVPQKTQISIHRPLFHWHVVALASIVLLTIRFPSFFVRFSSPEILVHNEPNHSQPVNTGSPSFQMTKTPSDRSDEEFVVNLHAAGWKNHASREPRLSREGRQVPDNFGGKHVAGVCVCQWECNEVWRRKATGEYNRSVFCDLIV